MAEFEVKATVEGEVTCPNCGQKFVAEVTGETTVEIEPDDADEPSYTLTLKEE